MAKLTLTTGVKTYDIEDENGKLLCKISFNTTDLNMMNRIKQMQENVQEAMPTIENFQTDDEAFAFLESDILPQADRKIRDIIDEAFGAKICDQVFGVTNCLTPGPDGSIYVERFMDMIAPAIAESYKEALEASEKRISKYTSQVK